MSVRSGDAATADRELVKSRVFDAPKDLVFKMWTDPAHVGKWWGPRGFTTTTHAIDIRPGGVWRFVMHGPDGTDYDNEIRYVEIDPSGRLVYDHTFEPVHRTTVLFENEGTGTRVSVRMVFASVEERDKVVEKYGAGVGLEQHLESLADELVAAQSPYLMLNRVFNAPRELVWKMWTQPEHMAKWWGPHGYTAPTVKIDLRKGGTMLTCMRAPDGKDGWFGGVYEDVTPPERFVLRHYFCDANGNKLAPAAVGFPPDFPDEMTMTVTFTDLGDQTKVTVHQTMPKQLLDGGAYTGWSQSFDKLAAILGETAG